ncbi:MAG: hypothetical protein AB1796_05085 [Bacillota bacterium]
MDCYRLDLYGRLQCWQFKQDTWSLLADNIFKEYLKGFDGAIDDRGALHLLGYDANGNIYLIINPEGDMPEPHLIYRDSRLKLRHLSCCFEPLKQLHILYLAVDKQKKMQQLYYLRCQGNKVEQPTCVDSLAGTAGSHCWILSDLHGNIFMLHPMIDDDYMRLAFRKLDIGGDRPGRIFLLPGKQDGLCWPSYYCDDKNNIHISWINRHEGKAYLNYIQRDKTGNWQHYLQAEVPPQTLPVAPLSFIAGDLLLAFRWENRLGLLYSRDGGLHWSRGKDEALEQESVLIRLRLSRRKREEVCATRDYFSCRVPPEHLSPRATTNSVAGDEDNDYFSRESQILDVLSSYAFERARRMEEDRSSLEQKLQQKEKELSDLRAREQLRIAELEQKITNKTLQLDEAELLFTETLQKYQERLEREKSILREQINLLRIDVRKLQGKKEKLLQDSIAMSQQIAIYEQKERAERISERQKEVKSNFLSNFVQRINTVKR